MCRRISAPWALTPRSSILGAAQEEDADLIAMASHGRTGLASVFYGSKAAGVLQQIDRPLLLVRVGKA